MEIIEHISLYTIPCDCNIELGMSREEVSSCYDFELDLYLFKCPKCGRTIIISPEELDRFHRNNKILIKNLESIDIEMFYDKEIKEIIQKTKKVNYEG